MRHWACWHLTPCGNVLGQQLPVQALAQCIYKNTNLSESCEESVHHRRLPMDGISNTVTFGHSVTEETQNTSNYEAAQDLSTFPVFNIPATHFFLLGDLTTSVLENETSRRHALVEARKAHDMQSSPVDFHFCCRHLDHTALTGPQELPCCLWNPGDTVSCPPPWDQSTAWAAAPMPPPLPRLTSPARPPATS